MMKQVIFKYLLFATVYLLGLWAMRSASIYSGPPGKFLRKLNFIIQNQDSYDGIVIGSSHVNTHIDCDIFEEVTGRSLFNLGQASMGFTESIFNLEKLLDHDKLDEIDFVVLLIDRALWGMKADNRNTLRSHYYLSFYNFQYLALHYYHTGHSEQLSNFLYSYALHFLGIGEIQNAISSAVFGRNNWDGSPINKHGYSPRRRQTKQFRTQVKREGYDQFVPGVNFKSPIDLAPLTDGEAIVLRELNRIKVKLNSKGIDLILIFNPNLPYHRHLTNHKVIYMGDGSDVPDLFYTDYKYNIGHYNIHGAEIFSRLFAEKFNSL